MALSSMPLLLDCLLIVGSFFIANLMRWVQGIKNLVLWQINVADLHIFTCVMLNYRGVN